MALGRDLLASAFSCEVRPLLLELRAGLVLLAAICSCPPATGPPLQETGPGSGSVAAHGGTELRLRPMAAPGPHQ